ncbi:FAD:protein FMN transferase [Lachnospiraceae bacterium WCA-9-b2]|uniref:FAD:protein FMN transferase n=1 Tax=Sporofaciens musculi TaxID=2681861 RepID=A0A7X3MGH3_9FIRM|nr:FAD:protein FMN transferase [Sporofaciens musculi]MCI9423495.1 FAD:protein FMN transferase [Dorea sp.]MXP75830.1 FAD:protein FMN transferase [Sporofaciens musculi]
MKYKKLTALLVSAALLLSGCSGLKKEQNQVYTDTLFDTVVRIEILDRADEEVLKGCENICKKYHAMFSNKIEDSEISRINSAGGNSVEVSDETVTLLRKAIYYGDLSNGAFDVTIAPVSNLWDFHAEAPALPAPEAIYEAASHVDYKNILIDGNTVRLLDPYASIDVGGIAKGYIADILKKYLKEQGVKHAVINLGGNVLAMGSRLDGSDYNIGIQKPFDMTGEPITSVRISNKSVVTSGTYQRYFEADGKLYHHILDPNTGYPCENNLTSVTIITNSSLTADALSTTCFLLGYDKSMRLIEQLDNVDAVFITNDNKIHYSKNFQHKLK